MNHRVWVNVVLNYLFDHSSQSNADTAEPQSSDPSFLSRPLLVIELIRVSVGDDIRVAIDSFDLENHLAKMLEQELGTSSF